MINKRQSGFIGVLRRLRAGRQGATAPIFALMLPALLGATALAFDVGNYGIARTQLQIAADSAALAAVHHLDTPAATAQTYIRANLPETINGATAGADVIVGTYSTATGFVPGAGASANAVRVTAIRSPERGNKISSFLGFVGLDTVTVTATAAKPDNSFYEPPESTKLDNEAGDYNEIYAYCFDYGGTGPAASRRSQMTLISNNMPDGQSIVAISRGVITADPSDTPSWPDCRGKNTSISFRLRNVRHAKAIPSLWQNPLNAPGRTEYNHYTDTVLNNGRESFSGLQSAILETVLCNTPSQCDNRSGDFIGHKGSNRTPDVASGTCEPGKFMYFGWEDRPPGQVGANQSWTDPAWTDTDYDDITLRLKCPRSGQLGNAFARLVQ